MNGFPESADIARRFIGRDVPPTPDRLAAIETVCDRVAIFIAKGWAMRPWHPTSPGSPCVIRDGRMIDWDAALIAGWMDHHYRLIPPHGAAPIFVSEPYQIGGAALVRLQYLRDNGWRVDVWPGQALHYPGYTVAIWITKGDAR